MLIEVLKSKLHCVTVTEANINYMGSITIDEDLLDAANMIAGEKVQIVDNINGERFETYIIKGERGSGEICLNGAAARKVLVGDTVIIMSYALMDFEEAKALLEDYFFAIKEEKVENPLILCGRDKEDLEKLLIAYMGLSGLLWSLWCAYKMRKGQEFGEYSLKMLRYFKDAKKILDL